MIFVALVGVTLILVRGTIFRPLQRFWPALFQCSQCVGMWVGLTAGASGMVSLSHERFVGAAMGHERFIDVVLVGAITSCLSLAADALLVKLLGDPTP
jgi:hypothetical protein